MRPTQPNVESGSSWEPCPPRPAPCKARAIYCVAFPPGLGRPRRCACSLRRWACRWGCGSRSISCSVSWVPSSTSPLRKLPIESGLHLWYHRFTSHSTPHRTLPLLRVPTSKSHCRPLAGVHPVGGRFLPSDHSAVRVRERKREVMPMTFGMSLAGHGARARSLDRALRQGVPDVKEV